MLSREESDSRLKAIKELLDPLGVYLPDAALSVLALWGYGMPRHGLPWSDSTALLLHDDCIEAIGWNSEDNYHQSPIYLDYLTLEDIVSMVFEPNSVWATEYWRQGRGKMFFSDKNVPPTKVHWRFRRPILERDTFVYPETNDKGQGRYLDQHLDFLVDLRERWTKAKQK